MEEKAMKLYDSCPTQYEDEIRVYCEETDFEMPEEGSEKWWDLLCQLVDDNYEFLMDTINESELGKRTAVITGTLGLWYGDREIMPTVCQGLQNAIEKCASMADSFEVQTLGGEMYVAAHHHDGTNRFTIRVMNPFGEIQYAMRDDFGDFDFSNEDLYEKELMF